jgi:hypothetical protein
MFMAKKATDPGLIRTPSGLYSRYGIEFVTGSDPLLVSLVADALEVMPDQLVRDCGIKRFGFEDLGESKEYYPNHGYYVNDTLVLNSKLPEDQILFSDPSTDKSMNRLEHTLYHELGHGWDAKMGDLSIKPEWLDLSSWSESRVDGHVRIVINDGDSPEMVGEWCYSPDAKFVRFYARRNPWDDFADTFSFFVKGQKGFVPPEKAAYFDSRLGKYYE